MCVFMLKPCNSTRIWWYIMCWNWECMCVFMLKPYNSAGIWWYSMCWNWKWLCMSCNEFVIRCRNWVVCNELAFTAKNVFHNKFVIHCRKWVVCSELTFVAELCVLQWIWDSLLKLYCLQWINIRCWIVCSTTNLGFIAEVDLSAANL